MSRIIKVILILTLASPIVLIVGFVKYRYYERHWTIEYIVEEIRKIDDVKILDISDENEEYPFCCTAIYVNLKVQENEIEIWNLNSQSFSNEYDGRVELYRVNGSMPVCGSSSTSKSLGIDVTRFPTEEIRNLRITNAKDLLKHQDKLVKYIMTWPRSYENGIKANYPRSDREYRCYLFSKQEFKKQTLDKVLP